MRKLPLILLCLLTVICIGAMPFLCSHPNMLPEVSTAYYEHKAKEEALTATGPEAELMRMLTGLTADTELEPVSTVPVFTSFGLFAAIGTVAALALLLWRSVKKPGLVWAGALAVPFGLIGARLVYCLTYLPFYLNDIAAPEAMLKVWDGGWSLSGALAFAVLAGVIGAKLGKTPISHVLNEMVIPMLLLVITTAIGRQHIHMGFGPEVATKFGGFTVTIGETLRLDTSRLVISAMVALCFVWLWREIRLYSKGISRPDVSFALAVFLYGSVMILMESLREDGHMVWGFVHAEMLLDLLFALPALLYLAKTKKRILLSLLASAALAGAVVALEFALDRSAIGDGLLYAVYVAILAAYSFLGWQFTRTAIK